MIWISGFYVALNLFALLPHVGGIGESWGKVIVALAIGICGWMWVSPNNKNNETVNEL